MDFAYSDIHDLKLEIRDLQRNLEEITLESLIDKFIKQRIEREDDIFQLKMQVVELKDKLKKKEKRGKKKDADDV